MAPPPRRAPHALALRAVLLSAQAVLSQNVNFTLTFANRAQSAPLSPTSPETVGVNLGACAALLRSVRARSALALRVRVSHAARGAIGARRKRRCPFWRLRCPLAEPARAVFYSSRPR